MLAGTTPRRESSISLPGVNRYSQAYREATERLNKLLLNDLSCTLSVFDEALALEVGDVVDVSHPIGLSAKLMRVMAVDGSYGRYTLNLVEYDPAVYSAAVATAPTWADTNLPNPAAPPAITGVVMTEEVFQLENGIWSSRWRITWDAAAYAFLANYRAELWDGSVLVQASNPSGPVWATSAVKEGVPYTAKIYAVTTIGAVGAAGTQAATPLGKFLIPSDVPSVSAFEAGGTVYVSWTPSVDIDIWKYEVRYGTAGWDAATVVDRLEALRLTTVQIPVGTWTLYVKAIDSIQQYSTNPATCSVTVTSDTNAFLVDTKDQTAPTLTNMAEYSLARTDPNRYFVSEDGVAFGTKYTSNLATYSNPLSTYHTSMTSTWQGEAEDFGLLIGGNWRGIAQTQVLSGAITSYLGYGDVGISTWVAGLSQKFNARFVAIKHEATTTGTILVTIPDQKITIEAVTRNESGTDTSNSSYGKTQYLTNDYLYAKSISIAPQGSAATSWTFDNVGNNTPNPADKNANIVLTGSVITKTGADSWSAVRCKHPIPPTGKWYWECFLNNVGPANNLMIGVSSRSALLASNYTDSASLSLYTVNGSLWPANTAYSTAYSSGDTVGLAYDSDIGQLTFYKNNVSQGPITGLTGEKFPVVELLITIDSQVTFRTTEAELMYAPPAGYSPLPFAFDVYLFNQSGTKVSQQFIWSFQGV